VELSQSHRPATSESGEAYLFLETPVKLASRVTGRIDLGKSHLGMEIGGDVEPTP